MEKVKLVGLDCKDFRHQLDADAYFALKKLKGLDFIASKVLEYGLEKVYRIANLSSSVRVNEKQCPRIHNLLKEACAVLDIPVPQLYIALSPEYNAFTSGHKNPFVILTTGMVELLSEEELLFVLGHELGHIKCEHVLYNFIAYHLSKILTALGQITLGIGTIIGQTAVFALMEWVRKAEFSADRAGLLVVQNPEVALNVQVKLAGGIPKIFGELDIEEFVAQADEFNSLDEDGLSRLYKFLQYINLSHPWTVVRAKEIKKWVDSGEYQRIIDGNYKKVYGYCSACGAKIDSKQNFCMNCGNTLKNG